MNVTVDDHTTITMPNISHPSNMTWRSPTPGSLNIGASAISSEATMIGSQIPNAALAPSLSMSHPRDASKANPHTVTPDRATRHHMNGRTEGNPYIIPSPSSTSTLFATVEVSGWPRISGSATTPSNISHRQNVWQPNSGHDEFIPAAPRVSYTQPPVVTYVGGLQQPFNQPDTPEYWSLGTQPFQNTLGLEFPMHDTTNYPSPRSEGSRSTPTIPRCPPFMAPNLSPRIPQDTSPTSERSSGSQRDSSGNQEPSRDRDGRLYCDIGECATDPKTFPRKCEWT